MKDQSSEGQYDQDGNANHYDSRINVLTQIESIWGTRNTMIFCEITEFKYRMRLGKKEGQPLNQELKKANWYSRAAEYLKNRLDTDNEVYEADEGNPMKKSLKKIKK